MWRLGVAVVLLTAVCGVFAWTSEPSANELVRRVVSNELKSESQDHSHWMFRLDTKKKNSSEEVDEVVETKQGDLTYPISINGRGLSPQEQQRAQRKLQELAKNPGELQKSLKDKDDDEAHSQRMLKLLPQAFVFQYGERRGDLVELKFTPNPHFKPPNREATVFHAMEGSLWVDSKQARVAQITGRLMQEVKFGGGLFGHLDKGGQFDVKQEEVSPGFWELTALNVQMNGKALFFKTISVRQKYTRSNFKRVPDNLEVARGLAMLHEQLKSQQAALR